MPIRIAWRLPLLLLILLLCTVRIANAQSKRGGGQPDGGMDEEALYVASVAFQNNFRCTNRCSHPNPFPTPEYLATYPSYPDIGDYLVVRNLATAYRKGSSIQVRIHVAASSFTRWQGTFRLTSVTYGEGSESWSLIATPSSFSLNLAPNGGQTVVTTLSGAPDFVYKGNLTLRYQIQRSSGIQIPLVSPSTAHRLYLVYDTPQSPMATPWTEVLEDACGFARCRSTASEVARCCTTGLFFAQRFYYPGDGGTNWVLIEDRRVFKLTAYYDTSGWVPGNCVDVSDFLTICQNALGLSFHVQQYTGSPLLPDQGPPLQYYFWSNPVCLIGSDPTDDRNYHAIAWVFHQMAFSGTGTLYDACAAHKYDLDEAAYRNPPFNWSWSDAWSKVAPSGRHLGIVDIPMQPDGLPNAPDPNPSLIQLSITGPYVPQVR